MHPWQKARLEEEVELKKEYGLKNKREVWKELSLLNKFIDNYKKTTVTEQAQKEKQTIVDKMVRYGIIKPDATPDDVLGLSVRAILERRLQTLLVRKNLARSMKQARQFIVHRHIAIGDKVLTSPSYKVSVDEQSRIQFIGRSPLFDEAHPERKTPEQEELAKIKEEAEAAKAPKEEKPEEKPEEQSDEGPVEIPDVEESAEEDSQETEKSVDEAETKDASGKKEESEPTKEEPETKESSEDKS